MILSDFEPVEVGGLIAAVVAEEQQHAKKMDVEIKVNVAPNLPVVPGDAKSLERALRAILNNAVKFSLGGGVVEIVVDHNPSYVWVSVKDQGIGIPEENHENIFKRFWRTEEHQGHLFGGVGLGLPIARQVIEQHEGSIQVQSKMGQGSIFTVRLKLNLSQN